MAFFFIFLEMYFKERWADISLSNICNIATFMFIYAKNFCTFIYAVRTSAHLKKLNQLNYLNKI